MKSETTNNGQHTEHKGIFSYNTFFIQNRETLLKMAINIALGKGDVKLLELLLQKNRVAKSDIKNFKITDTDDTILMLAAKQGNIQLTEWLLRNDICTTENFQNQKNNSNDTPFTLAVKHHQYAWISQFAKEIALNDILESVTEKEISSYMRAMTNEITDDIRKSADEMCRPQN